ncbi:MAG: molybdopterin-dependent oxidoreductase [Kofleriaceae bacterium]
MPKVHKAKAVDLGPTIVLDQERCILCTRCIRVCDEVAGEHQLEMAHRGDHEVLTTAPGAQLDNPYSLNTVDVCPVGALTSKDFRFTMRAWELSATPTVCTGCATGCNAEVHHKDGRAWRMVPRFNPAVNQYWMCDEGRFTYHELRGERLAAAVVDGLPAGWDRALARVAEVLAASTPSTTGVVLSATHGNEDNFALAKLAQGGKAGHVFISGRPAVPGRADDRLRDADVNANTAGVRAIAQSLGLTAQPLADLDAALIAGTIKTLIVLGDVLPLTHLWKLKEIELVVVATHERGPAKLAAVALPAAAWAETDSTSTNRAGLVQRLHAAFAPPGQAVPAWEAFARISAATGGKASWTSARDVFKDMTSQVSAFAGATWGRQVRPLALRFANSRG